MADWYASSANYAAVSAWAATTGYTVGQFVKPTAPGVGREFVFRCTVAGTSAGSEPTWTTANANNATIASGGATFTNVTGQSTYGWSAAAGTLYCLGNITSNRLVVGDRAFVASNHSESLSGAISYGFGVANYGLLQIMSVNRAGSVPPVAADLLAGAAITVALSGGQSLILDSLCAVFWYGMTFTVTGTPISNSIVLNSSGTKWHYFKDCNFVMSTTTGNKLANSNAVRAVLDNTKVQFGATGGTIGGGAASGFELTWINTASAISGSTFPTTLFNLSNGTSLFTCRGVDFSAITGTLVGSTGSFFNKVLLDSCRIASSATRLATPSGSTSACDEIELVNCYDGTNTLNERYTPAGMVTTDRSTTLSGGAQDDIGAYSLKLVSSTRSDFQTLALEAFWLDVGNAATGSSKTATVEIISSGPLNNTDIRLQLEYMGTSGSSLASFSESLASVLTASAALSSSAATWNSPPATPQKQYLQVTFTPQTAGRVRGLVRLGKISTTVWVNPQITIS